MDRSGADFFNVLEMLEDRLHSNFVPIQIPIGSGETFNGMVDLIEMKSITFEEASHGANFFESEIPDDLLPQAMEYRERMLDSVAAYDDRLLEKFLEGQEIDPQEIRVA